MPAETAFSRSADLRFLLRMAGGGRVVRLGALMVASSATEGLGLLMLVPIAQIVSGSQVPGLSDSWLGMAARQPLEGLLAIFVALVALRAMIVLATLTMRRQLSLTLIRNLRIACQDALFAANWRWLSTRHSADHAAMIVGGAERIGHLSDLALSMATGCITLAGLLVAAFYISWPTTLAAIGASAAAATLISLLQSRRRRDADTFVDAYTMLQRHVANGLTHLRAARIAGAQKALASDFSATALLLQQAEHRYRTSSDRARGLLQIIAAIMLALLVYAALEIFRVPLPLLLPMLAIFARMVPIAGTLQDGVRSWQFARPELDRLLDLLAEAAGQAEPAPDDHTPLALRTEIAVDGMSIHYPGRQAPALDRFSLAIPAGSVVGVRGPSGSGKSTLADVISGLIAPDDGALRIDGTALDGPGRMRWRRSVAYVEQHPFLLDGSIRENLCWGLPAATPEAMESAIEAASAGFVHRLPQGLETRVGENGRQLSGGERQRLALARALLRRPALLILDEVTSALDAENEASVLDSIAALRGSCTILLLSHSPKLLALADTIVDLGDGAGEAAGHG